MAGRWILAAFGAVTVGVTVAYLLTEPLLGPGDRVLLIGDSLAVGLGNSPAYGSASALSHDLAAAEVQLVARGEGATTSLQWSGTGHLNQERLRPALAAGVRAVVVVLGTNDCHYDYGHCPPFRERVLAIAREIRAAGATPVLVAMPPMPWESNRDGAERMRYALEAMRHAANETGGIFIDRPRFEIPRWPDRLHPNPEGARLWSKYIVDQLASARRWKG